WPSLPLTEYTFWGMRLVELVFELRRQGPLTGGEKLAEFQPGVFPFFRSAFQQSKRGSRHMFQHVPPTRFVVRPQQKYGLCTSATPKETRPFQAQIDHTPHCTFNRSAPDRKLHGA